jgi:CubicO group peptidase (beta-lactamase class C family)
MLLGFATIAVLIVSAMRAAGAEDAPAELPDTPTGKLARQWLTAINSGDTAAMTRFIRESFAQKAFQETPESEYLSQFQILFAQSGGLEAREVLREKAPLEFLVRAWRGNHWAFVRMGMSDDQPGKLIGMAVMPAQSPDEEKAEVWPTEKLPEAEVVKVIARNTSRRAEKDRFSGVVLVAKGDRILFKKACGLADRNFDVPNRLNTKFHLGSMGKMFTSVAIAQLVQAGKLAYEDTLANVLPDYPNREAAAKITLHHLLTHTAGLGGLFDEPKYDRRVKYRTQADYFPIFANNPLPCAPGAHWAYSNEGFIVLGAVIEKVTGQNYVDYVREHIFLPAGMKDTDNYALDEVVPNRAVGYLRNGEDDPLGLGPRRPNSMFEYLGWRGNGCGGCYSTAPDMLKFAQALRGHRLLPADLTEQITSGKVIMGGDEKYGYGFIVSQLNGKEVRGHSGGGGNSGINSDLEMFWDGSYTVIVLGNYDAPAAQDLDRKICAFLARQ